MDAVVLTWRWQNIIAVWIMVIALFLIITLGAQYTMKSSNSNG